MKSTIEKELTYLNYQLKELKRRLQLEKNMTYPEYDVLNYLVGKIEGIEMAIMSINAIKEESEMKWKWKYIDLIIIMMLLENH